MLFIFHRFFLLIIFVYSISYAPLVFPCVLAFSSPGEVFINFANKNQGGFGTVWEKKISTYLKKGNWTAEDAKSFLEEMEARIGVKQTLKRIKTTSYFWMMSYVSFKDRVSLYEEYIGIDGVTKRLNRSLGGFDRGNVEDIRDVITYLHIYFGGKEGYLGASPKPVKPVIHEMMQRSLVAFSSTSKSKIQEVIEYLEGYLGVSSKPVIQEMMQRNLVAFSSTSKSKIQEVVEYVEGYLGASSKPVIQRMMQNDFIGFEKATRSNLKDFAEYVKKIILLR